MANKGTQFREKMLSKYVFSNAKILVFEKEFNHFVFQFLVLTRFKTPGNISILLADDDKQQSDERRPPEV